MPIQPPLIFGPSGRGAPQQLTAGGWQVITKTADESRNTSATSIDSQLKINVSVGSKYRIRVTLFVTASANGVNSNVGFAGPGNTFFIGQHYATPNSNTLTITGPTGWTPTPHTAYGSFRTNAITGGEYTYYLFDVIVIPSASGVFGVSWGQSVNNPAQTCTVSRGSTLEYVAF